VRLERRGVRGVPRLELGQPVGEEDVQEREKRLVLGGNDGVEFEERVKVEDRGIAERARDRVEGGGTCVGAARFERAHIRDFVVVRVVSTGDESGRRA
jgi:hypothetical protein